MSQFGMGLCCVTCTYPHDKVTGLHQKNPTGGSVTQQANKQFQLSSVRPSSAYIRGIAAGLEEFLTPRNFNLQRLLGSQAHPWGTHPPDI